MNFLILTPLLCRWWWGRGGRKLGLAYSRHCALIRTQVPFHFFFFCMDPLTNDGVPGAISNSPKLPPPYGAPSVRTWLFQATMG